MEPSNATAPDIQPASAPENSPAVDTTQAGQTPLPTGGDKAAGDTSREYAELLAKADTDPDYQYSGDELDKVMKFRKDGVTPSALKPKAAELDAEGNAVVPAEKPVTPQSEITPILEAVGAKDHKEAAEMVKRIIQDKENITRASRNQDLLFQDLRAGKPEAVAYFEKNFGGKFVPNGQVQQPAQAPQTAPEVINLPKEMFISDEAHAQANGALEQMRAEIKEIRGTALEWKNERENYSRSTAQRQAEAEALDSFVSIGEKIGGFDLKTLRADVTAWMQSDKPNPKMDAFNKILDITKKHGSDLEGAFLIYQGMNSAQKIEDAKKAGREEAYGHKPSPPLSTVQGKGNQVYSPITDQDALDFASGDKPMPESWFDPKTDKPVKERIPQKMWKHFGYAK